MENIHSTLFQQRWQRIEDAIHLLVPDRVPVLVDFGYLAAKYYGISKEKAIYDRAMWARLNKRIVEEFQPDIFQCMPFISGPVYEAINTKLMRWPGKGLGPDESHQYVEGEYMKSDEYNSFILDPLEFILNRFLPRASESFRGFENTPDAIDFMSLARGNVGPIFVSSPLASCIKVINSAGEIAGNWNTTWGEFAADMEGSGYPTIKTGGGLQAPFDFISDHLRGMRGAMLDMYRQPDKLHEAMQKVLAIMVKRAKALAGRGSRTLVFMGPHRGSDGFMSGKQFKEFYWPGLKVVIETLIEAGVTPYMFWEGDYTSRLEFLTELPSGKIINRFDRTDLFKAREILGQKQCIAGGPLPGLLQVGTPDDVKEYCKKIIQVVGKDGCFILSHSCVLDEAKPGNVKAMIDSAREYGVYI
jgi:hypothetical protein